MERIRNKKNYQGFSLIESLIGVAIAGVVFVTFLNILPKMIQAEIYARDNIIAVNLAQEGIEMVRNVRDNALKNNDCENVFVNCGLKSPLVEDEVINNFSLVANNFASNSLFTEPQFNGAISKFTRDVTININADNQSAEVTCTVSWSVVGTTKSVVIVDTLSAWGEKE